jgi:hypothetical protein
VDGTPPKAAATTPDQETPLPEDVAPPSNPTSPQPPPGGQVPAPPNVAPPARQVPQAPDSSKRPEEGEGDYRTRIAHEHSAYVEALQNFTEDTIQESGYQLRDCGTNATASCAYCCMAHQSDPITYPWENDKSSDTWNIRKFRNELVIKSLDLIANRINEVRPENAPNGLSELSEAIDEIKKVVEVHRDRGANQSIFKAVEVDNANSSKTRKFYDLHGELTIDATACASVKPLRADLEDYLHEYAAFISEYSFMLENSTSAMRIAYCEQLLSSLSGVRASWGGLPCRDIIYKHLVLLRNELAKSENNAGVVALLEKEIENLTREEMNKKVIEGVSAIITAASGNDDLRGALTLSEELQRSNDVNSHPLKAMQSALEAIETKYTAEKKLGGFLDLPPILQLLHNIANTTNCEHVYAENAEYALYAITEGKVVGVVSPNPYCALKIYFPDGRSVGYKISEQNGEENFSDNGKELMEPCNILVYNNATGLCNPDGKAYDSGIHWHAIIKNPAKAG